MFTFLSVIKEKNSLSREFFQDLPLQHNAIILKDDLNPPGEEGDLQFC